MGRTQATALEHAGNLGLDCGTGGIFIASLDTDRVEMGDHGVFFSVVQLSTLLQFRHILKDLLRSGRSFLSLP